MSIVKKSRILSLLLVFTVLFVLCFAVSVHADPDPEPEPETEPETTEETTEETSEETTGETTEETTAETTDETTAAVDDANENGDGENTVNVGQIISFIVLGVLVIVAVVICIIKREKVGKFLRALNSERKKIVWYPWDQTLKSTAVVLVIVIICAAVIAGLDFAFSQGVNALNTVI